MMNNPQTTINVASGSCASFALTVSQIFLFLSGAEAAPGRFPVGGVHQHHRRRQQDLNVPQQEHLGLLQTVIPKNFSSDGQ